MKTFQTLFPPLSPKTITLSSARRVVLVSYNAERGTIDFRHYLITVKPYGVSKRVRKVLEGATSKSTTTHGFLDLGNEKDVADFLLRKKGEPGPSSDGYESAASSASSVAGDDADAISLADDYVGRNNKKGQKRAVRLDEIGPRMELRLIKIVEGTPGKEGNVIYHEFGESMCIIYPFQRGYSDRTVTVKKTKAEVTKQKAEHDARERLRKQRRAEQERNVERKKNKQTKTVDGEDLEDQDAEASHDEEEEAEAFEEGDWDDEEEISEGEEVSEDEASEAEESSEDEETRRPPPKKQKMKGKR